MRMMLFVTFPTRKFNEMWERGEIGPKMQQILEDIKPEAVYFGRGERGQRGVVVIVDIPTPSDLSRFTEPWYLTFEASVETSICMTLEDVAKIDMEALAEKYG